MTPDIRYAKSIFAFIAFTLLNSASQAELKPLEETDLRAITGQSALQYSATDISYDLDHLVGVEFSKKAGIGFTRSEKRSVSERVNATVHRLQINGNGEFHAFAEELTLGDYGGSNNSIYKDENGQGVPDVALRNFGFGESAEKPFYIEDPYIEIQQQNHPDGTQSFRGFRIGFGKAEGHSPVTIDSISGYIPTLSVLAESGGLIRAQVYGSGTKDSFGNIIGDTPDGTGNYAQTPAPGERQCNGIWCANTPNNVQLTGNTALGHSKGGKEINLEHIESLDLHNVENFYISLTQGGGNSFVNNDGTVNGAKWSQHLTGIIPSNRPDLPGWNLALPFNDPNNPTAGYVEAHTDIGASLSQILFATGDNNPRQQYRPIF